MGRKAQMKIEIQMQNTSQYLNNANFFILHRTDRKCAAVIYKQNLLCALTFLYTFHIKFVFIHFCYVERSMTYVISFNVSKLKAAERKGNKRINFSTGIKKDNKMGNKFQTSVSHF